LLWLLAAFVAAFVFSLFLGRYPSPPWLSPARLAEDDMARRLVVNLRLPRLVVAGSLGMTMGAAGTVLQMLFANPLVEPGFLGVSQGAAFGAALAIIAMGNVAWQVQLAAVAFAFLGLALSYGLARRLRYGGWILRLVLSGIAVSALFSAGLGVVKFWADPVRELPEITFWLLGGLWGVSWTSVKTVLPAVGLGLYVLWRMRWRLNLLCLEDATAFSLGVSPGRERAIVLVAAVVPTAAVVAVSGMVGWVGLIVPHLARRLLGADARFSLPGSMLLGGLFTVICDDLARVPLPVEIPLGILTSLLGAASFLVLMLTRARRPLR
jgi:iron complex transport system permease protein